MFNLLTEKIISAVSPEGERSTKSLPGVMSGLARGEIESFPALRPHQRHVWHAFLVQLGAAVMAREGRELVPASESEWTYLIRDLTKQWPDDEPWSLVVPDLAKPAFLQPPVPPDTYTAWDIETPDSLDILITSKHHDIKADSINDARPEDWLFALVSLQTQQGVYGRGKYGISRMNGGYGSRPGLGIDQKGNAGFRFRRDLLALSQAILSGDLSNHLPRDGKLLLWLDPWDGESALPFSTLHPVYIEICRRVRLGLHQGRIAAADAPTKDMRVSGVASLKGNVGDPWVPFEAGGGPSLTISGHGFTYQKLTDLLDSQKYTLPLLAAVRTGDPNLDITLVARGMTRGQGKTEGYHERHIPIPPKVVGFLKAKPKEASALVAETARKRVDALGELRAALNFSLKVLSQAGPETVADKETTKKFVSPWLSRFEADSERGFFEDLWNEIEAEDKEAPWFAWMKEQRKRGQELLEEASCSLPHPLERRYRAKTKAESAFYGVLYNKDGHFKALRDHEIWEKENAAHSSDTAGAAA